MDELANELPITSARNLTKISDNPLRRLSRYWRNKKFISILLVSIILITIIVTIPTVVVHKKKKIIGTITTTTAIATTTTEDVPLYHNITNTTKWTQNGITILNGFDRDSEYDTIYFDHDDETVYIGERRKHRIIEYKFNTMIGRIVAGGNGRGNGTDQLDFLIKVGFAVDKKTDSIIICDFGNDRVVRWSLQNTTNGNIIISDVFCIGIAIDDKGYIYISDPLDGEVTRWDIENYDIVIVADGFKRTDNDYYMPYSTSIFIDEDYSIYVADETNHLVMKWMKNTTKRTVVAGENVYGDSLMQLNEPSAVVVDHLGNVYVSDRKNHRVMRWINGTKEGSIVVGGNGPGNEPNQLYLPADLVFDKYGNLYVFDAGNYRVQKFNIESN